jgi:PncC family amidohydrolase
MPNGEMEEKMDKFIVNIIHRPEMVPEYAEKVTGHGKEEDLGRKALLTESLDIFKFQQETAHKNGLKTTIQMTYASLFNDEAVALAKADHEKYGDEIALSLLGLPCTEFREKYKTKDFCIWMFSMEDKKSIVDDVFGKFHEKFGFYPESTGSYYMDADLTNYIKATYPTVKCAVATCWEEGPKAYHTCNNSWYTFMDGGPWAPWIPSKQNTHAPAANEAEDSGVVAIPHLSRDLLACYDGNGSNFGTHPQNVLRGMIYDTKTWEYPYLYNLIDQYRSLEKYNNGYAYNMMFVGPGWLNKMGRWEQPYELLKKSYEDGMKYYGDLKKEGKLTDMTMAEFADYYRQKNRIVLLPGPPAELIPMFDQQVLPYLDALTPGVICSRMVKLCGVPESQVEDTLKDLIDGQTNPTIATYAKTGEVHIRVTASGENAKAAGKTIKPIVKELKSRFGGDIYSTREETTLEMAVADLLLANDLTVTTAESCTGGMIAARIINVPGVSECYKAGLVTYSNKAKRKFLGVRKSTLDKYGAVSSKTAGEMAKGAALLLKADVAVAVTGIAGPDGGTEEKPVGLVYIGCCVKGELTVKQYHFSGTRSQIREATTSAALILMRSCILKYFSKVTFGKK